MGEAKNQSQRDPAPPHIASRAFCYRSRFARLDRFIAEETVAPIVQPERSDDETYLSYVSPLLLRRLRAPGPIVAPELERCRGAVALLDVERFSTFAERMSSRGSEGIEMLATRINETFAAVVDTIERFGGIAHGFPGDSVIALWPADGCTAEEATLRAAHCSLELVHALRDSELPLKAGLAAGELSFVHVGGIGGRVQMLLSGEPLDLMGRAEERSSRGRLVVSEAAWRLLSPHAIASALSDGFFEVKSIRTAASPVAAPAPAAASPIGMAEAARAYLPSALLRQLDAGHAAWLGEFREVTTVFIQIRPPASTSGDFAPVQEAFCAVQRSLYRYGGDVARFAHDDKGLAVLSVFGLAPSPSEDAAAHAVGAALQLQADALALGFGCRAGIATGRVFCGTLGAPRRREYSVVGSTPNLAARLMQSAVAGVICDAATVQAAGADGRFEREGVLSLKGFPQPIEAFRPKGAGAAVAQARSESSVVVGRETETRRLGAWIEDVHRLISERRGAGDATASAPPIEAGARRSCLAVVQGEAGIGKTTLVRNAVELAARRGLEVVRIACERVEASSSYATWTRAVAAMLRLDETPSRPARTARVRQALAGAGVEADLAPLASTVLDVDIEETDASREITGAARADNVLALLSRLVAHLAAAGRSRSAGLLLVLEDVHWLDAASWELLGVVTRSLDAADLGVLATMRSETAPTSASWHAIVASPETERIALATLSRSETGELARRLLGAPDVTPQLLQLVFERTRGNPFFSAQLLAAMSESGLVGVEGGVAVLRLRNPEQAESLVPRSVAAVVTSRLDRLPAPVQLTLKAASVLGVRFRIDVLRAIHPMQLNERTLLDHLAGARELGLVEDAGDAAVQCFQHAITCDVAYGMLLVSQRRELHRGAAEYLGRDGAAAQAVLFYHWRRSGDEARALEHVDRAGADAMRSGDYHAVIELYGYALQTIASRPEREAPDRTRPGREALWSAHLGEAQVAIGLHEAARPNLEMSLELLGESARRGGVALAGAITREALRQVAHRAAPARFEGARAAEAERLGLAASTFEQLGFVYYSSGEIVPGLYASLRILNLSELARIPHLMARSYAVMSLSASVVGQRRFATLYDRRAVDLARRHGDLHTSAYVGWVTALRATGEAEWELAAMRAEPALQLAEQLGDRRLAMMCLSTLGTSPYMHGEFTAAIAVGERQLAMARESNNRLWEAWGMNGIAEPALMLGDFDEAARCCTRALAVLAEENDRAEEVRALGILAAAQLGSGKLEEAAVTARRGLDRAEGSQSTSYIPGEGYAGICEVMLALGEEAHARSGAVPSSLRRDLERAVAAHARYAKTFPVGRARLHTARARAAMLSGSPSLARRELELALGTAEKLGLTHARGLALIAAARCAAFDPPVRRRHADEAVRVLRKSAALAEAKSLLGELHA
jgi:class 3 adenylate cyclase/tetratricopeptide (TPR) repeat protein